MPACVEATALVAPERPVFLMDALSAVNARIVRDAPTASLETLQQLANIAKTLGEAIGAADGIDLDAANTLIGAVSASYAPAEHPPA